MAAEGDLVLIYHQEQPFVFARIESIEPDIKKDWYHVTLLMLTIPAQTVTWILRDRYIDGEIFTMGGKAMRLEEVKRTVPGKGGDSRPRNEDEAPTSGKAEIIPFRRP